MDSAHTQRRSQTASKLFSTSQAGAPPLQSVKYSYAHPTAQVAPLPQRARTASDCSHLQEYSQDYREQPLVLLPFQKLDPENHSGTGAHQRSAGASSPVAAPVAAEKRLKSSSLRLSRHLYHHNLRKNDQENFSPSADESPSRPDSALQKPLSKPKQVLSSFFGGLSGRSPSSEFPPAKLIRNKNNQTKSSRHKPTTSEQLNDQYHGSTSSSQIHLPASLAPVATPEASQFGQVSSSDPSGLPSGEGLNQRPLPPLPFDQQHPAEVQPSTLSEEDNWSGHFDGTESQRSSIYSQPSLINPGLPREPQSLNEYPVPPDPIQDDDAQFHPGFPESAHPAPGGVAEQVIQYKQSNNSFTLLLSPRLSSLKESGLHSVSSSQGPPVYHHSHAPEVPRPFPLPNQQYRTQHSAFRQDGGSPLQRPGNNQLQGSTQSIRASPQPGDSPSAGMTGQSKNFSLPLSLNASIDHSHEGGSNSMSKYQNLQMHQESHHSSDQRQQQGGIQLHSQQSMQGLGSHYASQAQGDTNDGQYGYPQSNTMSENPQSTQYDQQADSQQRPQSVHVDKSQARQESSSSRQDADYESLRSKYNKLVSKHNQLKKNHGELQEKVLVLENSLASHNMTLTRTSLDDQKYSEGFLQISKNISQLSHLIRKSWKDVPMFLAAFVNHDALSQGGREMIAVGRSFISAFICREVFDKYYHSGLPLVASEHLRRVQLGLIRRIISAPTAEEAKILQSQLTTWRMCTIEGLTDKLKGSNAEVYRNAAHKSIVERLVRGIKKHLHPGTNFDLELENAMSGIVTQAFDLLNHMPYESRVIVVEYSVPKDEFNPATMKLCSSSIPPLGLSLAGNPPAKASQSSSGAKDGHHLQPENSLLASVAGDTGVSPTSSPVPTSPPVVPTDQTQDDDYRIIRFAVDLCVRILDRDVLHKMAVYI